MKTMIMTLLAAFALMSCGSERTPATGQDAPDRSLTTENTIVVYFSCTNTTKNIAEKISSALGCGTWRINPEEPYTSADLDYNSDCRANREQSDPSARPLSRSALPAAAEFQAPSAKYAA